MASIFKLQTIAGGSDLFTVDDSGNVVAGGTLQTIGATTVPTASKFILANNDDGGALSVVGYDSDATSVATGGAATTISAALPAGALVIGWGLIVTTTIAGINSTTGTLTLSGGSSATLGTISAFSSGTAAKGACAEKTTAATDIVFTLSGGADNTPSGGAFRVVVWYTSIGALTT